MKTLLCTLLLCLASHAQFAHVVIVVQENRTPDNLFGSCAIPGADLAPLGSPVPLNNALDLSHSHAFFLQDAAGNWPTASKSFVQNSDVLPYCDMAKKYGFGNRMFQTNQGPSGPAHQFIFGGTSAPVPPGQLHDDWFGAENSSGGCIANGALGNTLQAFIDPQGSENHFLTPCTEHGTLSDILEAHGITWRYYTPSDGTFWTAPNAIRHICQPLNKKCVGQDFTSHVVLTPSSVLTDIKNGNLQQVSWVIPAGLNSDHAVYGGKGGPAWVASIVNAVGASPYWQNTVIIITWDDWGGWYDHVQPMTNSTGWCPSYCYGFRVPFLAISSRTPANYTSNINMDSGGSILRFVEQNFNLPLIGNGTYADAYAQFDAGFFSGTPRIFKRIRARQLTKKELTDLSDPDDE